MYDTPLDQAWLRLWVDAYGPESRLKDYLHDDDDEPLLQPLPQPQKLIKLPVSDWAKSVIGDGRTSDITLQDILDGVEDYFEIFDQMKQKHPTAHAYFSRVGVPVAMKHLAVWKQQVDAKAIMNAASLPSFFGVFMAENKADYRKSLIENKPTLLDFHLFEKPKNHSASAPFGTTVFIHSAFLLSRTSALMSAEEKKRFAWIDRHAGIGWYVGVLPDGQVRALPYRRSEYQRLPNGGQIRHSRFGFHPGLFRLAGKKTPHDFVRMFFNIAVACAAASVSGITVTITKEHRRCRVGVPIAALKDFFADRDPATPGERRKPVLHFRHAHDRRMSDGRIIAVGEHLSGERFFTWRGYNISVGVPGVHYASPEGFNIDMFQGGNPDAPLPPEIDMKRMTPVSTAAAVIARQIQRPLKVPIRYGEPTRRFNGSTLPQPGDVKFSPKPTLLVK
jgi:hypothetical protein